METFFVEFNVGSLELSGIVTATSHCRMFKVEMVTNEDDPIILRRSLKGEWLVLERGKRTLSDKDFQELEGAIDEWLIEFYSAKRILVLTDFSEAAANAARYAALLSRDLKTRKLVLYHSFESILMPSTTGFAPVGPGFTESSAGSLEKITRLKESLEQLVLPETKIATRNDDRTLIPAVTMLVEQLRTGLVVVGMTGKSTLEQILIGSNTLDLAKSCPAPLLAVPSGATYQKIEKVVFACDLKNVVELTPLLAIKTFVKALGASLLILNVDRRVGDFDPDEMIQLSGLHELWDDQKPEYHFVENDDVAEGIIAFADRKGAQLVITIPGVYGFFEGIFHQRVTNQLASRSHVPLMLFRA
ncbi:universal stress protein [Pedobacter sp. PLR]|uniref:universal stress protein n=1 Tax=Pedobacter sp. PLR TaxID=2994465 RepID=UPI0022462C65|nr:universal stress protein [Pedobacter sp. PLR]MCX2454287.1 universal stress protein [Pedobacter sp. PLR]